MVRAFPIAVIVSLVLVATPAAADEPLDTGQSIIKKQITAFLSDDATTAYSFASPGIQGKFINKDVFFDMVKRAYQPVYRPGNFAFGRNKVSDSEIMQEVVISGPDGKDWTALYQLTKQPDGSWKINAVRMMQAAPGPEI
ncbi:DUF4864 domain-containing protein [Phyllobacterium sp. P30BS-XVII]|uniref:DUF4864 domain-containing protein n=1 Tax=Phyllobacterium sp. P30BS-XVII TaxID=2587046 RepID=UPI0015FC280A|nr:DUF4864 domain-containing protein [Phyllobacterium sp. P30BS-XVII]MBA8899569.1 hypothetical protein [Phyllobacterium sp. P30BS-XVII]